MARFNGAFIWTAETMRGRARAVTLIVRASGEEVPVLGH